MFDYLLAPLLEWPWLGAGLAVVVCALPAIYRGDNR